MTRRNQSEQNFPIKLTHAQRQAVANFAPDLKDRLKLGEPNQRIIEFTLAELQEAKTRTEAAISTAGTGTQRRTLRHVLHSVTAALNQASGSGSEPATERVVQLKITLQESNPPIWRRIQVQDCTLDKLHEHIQTAMGWTNSHLHHFIVNKQLYGNPELMQENFEELGYRDSTTTWLSEIVTRSGKTTRFLYEYDFGDSWVHEILFEKEMPAEPGTTYPRCQEGARACPPEDCGGIWSYPDFLEAVQNKNHERHEELLEWIGGSFDPEEFDPVKITREMQQGLPNWFD